MTIDGGPPMTTRGLAPAGARDAGVPGAPLLEMRHVGKSFRGGRGRGAIVVALDDFSLALDESLPRVVALAGESGSGKTTMANLVLGFLTPSHGEVLYRGRPVTQLRGRASTVFRQEVQAITQDPYSAFNPFYRVGRVFDTVIRNFPIASGPDDARAKVVEALEFVGLSPDRILAAYPHQLSGGERQRVMVARAFLLRPRLIVADEPVSMVDASIRATILELMLRMRNELGVSFLYITHDLSTARQIADELIILRRGLVVEHGDPGTVIEHPEHPYTRLLMSSIPIPDPDDRWQGRIGELQAELNEDLEGPA
jgi:peptide/nickel transport system ATP-binding protein